MREWEITPEELNEELNSAAPPHLLDVRSRAELEISSFPSSTNIILSELVDRINELDKEAKWVVVCRSGVRSAQATQYLVSNGFKNVRNLVGGINAWADRVDPNIQIY